MLNNMASIYNFVDYPDSGVVYLPDMFKKIKTILSNYDEYQLVYKSDSLEWLKEKVETFNSEYGHLDGYDCCICKNKGLVCNLIDNREVFSECVCIKKRNSLRRIENSGLKYLLSEYTFDNYVVSTAWQKKIKETAIKFTASDGYGEWFYIGGQVGCGKTHICTAIVSFFLDRGMSAKYMLWRDEVVNIKAKVTNADEYSALINPLKTVQVLYIDDFLKTKQGELPSVGDINVAFEILNYRYNDKSLITILSGEKSVDALINIDEALGSRVFQRTMNYCVNIGLDIDKNYRLR